jgi:hypothetical protein
MDDASSSPIPRSFRKATPCDDDGVAIVIGEDAAVECGMLAHWTLLPRNDHLVCNG